MKRIWIAAAGLGAAVSLSSGCATLGEIFHGQSGQGHHPGAVHGHASTANFEIKVPKELGLSGAQLSAVQNTVSRFFKSMAELHQAKELEGGAMYAKARHLRLGAAGELEKILNAEQKRKLSAHGGTASLLDWHGAHLHHMLANHNLTDAQKQAVHQVMLDTHRRFAAIDGDPKTNDDQKFELARKLHEETMQRIHNIIQGG